MAPYCAIPRDYLSNTPIARYGVFGVSTWPIGCDTPSPFSERFPLGEHAKWRCDTPPPPTKGVSQRYLRDTPPKEGKMRAIPPPAAILSRKGIAWYGRGIWATKRAQKGAKERKRAYPRKNCKQPGLRGHTLQGVVLGTFWKPPSQNPFWEPFSEPFFTVNPMADPLLRTLLRTLPQNPFQNLLRTLLRTLCCGTTP